MATGRRTRSHHSDPMERLRTKREVAQEPQKLVTCPPVARKGEVHMIDSLRRKAFTKRNSIARAVYFQEKTSLSNLYDETAEATYLCQLYRLSECIGEGSFGIVYKGYNFEDGRNYAIKLMKKYSSNEHNYSEIRRLEKTGNHENLVKYYYAWEESSVLCIQMELCALSLAIYTQSVHQLPLQQLWDILFDMLYALKHLHDRELVHLDIKPDNIMMTSNGKYKLGDFGLLIDLKEKRGPGGKILGVTSEGDAKYLAREVLEGNFSCAADIFSLGITMLELATDLVLPVNGSVWHTFRDESTGPYFDLIPQQLRLTVIRMMNSNFIIRPTVDKIFLFSDVKRALKRRQKTERVNYYTIFRANNVDEDEIRPVAVCVDPTQRCGNPQVVREVHEGGRMDMQPMNTATCVTPPKGVSQIILYSM